jgi:hypothetical protein
MDECDRCAANSAAGYYYCSRCGRPLGVRPERPKKEDTLHKITRAAGIIILIGCTAMLIFEIMALIRLSGDIWTGMEGYRLGIWFMLPLPTVLFYVSGIVAKFYILFLVFAVIVSFVLLMYNSRGGLSGLLKNDTEKTERTPLYSVVTLFAAYISINLLLVIFVTSFGYDPVIPEDPEEEWMLWYSLLNASVWEEVVSRVLLIGLPLMIAALAMKETGAWKRLFGGSGIDSFAVLLIFLSATLFAFAHVSGWDLFKVIPTFVCGLALGYVFVRYGLYASIMLHFLIDFSSSVVWIFGSSAAGEVMTTAEMMLTLFLFSMLILGIPFIIRYAKSGIAYLRDGTSDLSDDHVK